MPFSVMRLRNAGASGPWTPANGPSLRGWWVSDNPFNTLTSGFLTTLADKSGNGNTAGLYLGSSTNQATLVPSGLNSRTIWRSTTGTNRGFFAPTDLSVLNGVAGCTMAVVSSVNPSVGTTGAEVFRYQISGSASARTMIGRNNGLSASAGVVYAGGRRLDADSFQGAQDAINHGTSVLIQIGVFNYAAANLVLSVDGTLTTNPTFQTAGNVSTTNSNGAAIGHNGSGSSGAFGDYAEVVIFAAALGTTDRQKLEGYLAWQWGLAANLPIGHPYKLAPP